MKVKDLIAKLQEQNQEAEIAIWVAGTGIDTNWVIEDVYAAKEQDIVWIDINIENDDLF